MKKILILILIFGINKCFAQWSQYPIPQNLGRSPSTLVYTNSIKADQGIIFGSFADTAAANALPYLRYNVGTTIWSTSDSSLYTLQKSVYGSYWFKIGGSGGGATGSFWNIGGNLLPVYPTPYARIGTLTPYGGAISFITNSVDRLVIPDGGIVRSSAAVNKYLMMDTSTKEMYYGDGGSTTYTAGDGLLLTGSEFKVLTKRSITIDNDSLMLVNDSTASPVSYFYGTNVAGRKGWYAQSGITGVNLYNSDGTLTGDRQVSGNNKYLWLDNLTNFYVYSDGIDFEDFNSFIAFSKNTGATNTYYQQTAGIVTMVSRLSGNTASAELTTDAQSGTPSVLIQSAGATWDNSITIDDDSLKLTGSGSSINSDITVKKDSIKIRPYLGRVFIGTLTAGASTDSVLVRTASTGQVKYRNASAFGGTYTFTNGLTESGGTVKLGGTLVDATTTIATDGNDFTVTGDGTKLINSTSNGDVSIKSTGTNTSEIVSESADARMTSFVTATSSTTSSILVSPDLILVRPYLSALKIDSLAYTLSTTGKKLLIRDTATGLVQNIDPTLLTVSGVTAGSQGQIYQTSNGAATWKYDTTTLVTFTAGANFAADTAAFTDSTIYGSFKLMGNDTFYVTGVSVVSYSNNAITDSLGIQITYNDTINVIGSHVFAATYGVNNGTTGQDADADDFTGSNSVPIPPGNWVWLKSPTVVAGRKPYHLSVSIIGYKKRVN